MNIQSLIMLVVFVLILISLAPTITRNTTGSTVACGTADSASFNRSICPLENASTASKSMFNLIEVLFAVTGVMALVGYGMSGRS